VKTTIAPDKKSVICRRVWLLCPLPRKFCDFFHLKLLILVQIPLHILTEMSDKDLQLGPQQLRVCTAGGWGGSIEPFEPPRYGPETELWCWAYYIRNVQPGGAWKAVRAEHRRECSCYICICIAWRYLLNTTCIVRGDADNTVCCCMHTDHRRMPTVASRFNQQGSCAK